MNRQQVYYLLGKAPRVGRDPRPDQQALVATYRSHIRAQRGGGSLRATSRTRRATRTRAPRTDTTAPRQNLDRSPARGLDAKFDGISPRRDPGAG
jgi:hypothetical protein